MSKFDLWKGTGQFHAGYVEGVTVPQSAKLDALMQEFKDWFTSVSGFGEYLKGYYTHYAAYFDDYVEEHSLTYTHLHTEFSDSLSASIQQWLHSQGISEDDFGDMLCLARARGDDKSDEIVGTLLGMLDYTMWFQHIFKLRHDSRLAAAMATGGYACSAPPVAYMQAAA
eukprot:TRINITY_DN74893_c0_g1_i1.p1 TRINITY_DN74893_c0_g1~~TRINITY_DN74893_c0_g1_i1.p1  ORF type:complete len:169 (-),score=24.68 TRINITY_DN74893_c0_g1_i1:132-638(-)